MTAYIVLTALGYVTVLAGAPHYSRQNPGGA